MKADRGIDARRAVEAMSSVLESALGAMDLTLHGMQVAVARLGGEECTHAGRSAPVDGPPDLDHATADWANRMLRLALLGGGADGLADAARRALASTARSVPPSLRASPRRWLTLPFELPLSLGTLAVQEGLRALTTLQAIRLETAADLTGFVTEVFSDLQVYFSLQYGELLEELREKVFEDPEDAAARYDLGRTLIKCGLFQEAIRELGEVTRSASADAELRSRAHYWTQVAAYRMGDDRLAASSGAARLARHPEDDRSRYWLWLSAERQGAYPTTVPERFRMTARTGHHPTALDLEGVAATLGLDKTSGGRGTAVFDATGNGLLDVVVAGAHAGCSLYLNNGDGTFRDASTGSGLDACVYAFGLAVGDHDNNGLLDLFVTGLGFFDGQGLLMRNNGDGTFTDVTRDAGLGVWGPGFTTSWVDYDGDGWLDLFVVNNLGGLFDRKTPNRLFRNNRDGTFTDVTEEAGLTSLWPSLGHAWGDFANDGRQDLFVSNMGRAQLFRNNGDGTFTDVSREAGIHRPAIGSTALVCDIDDDGWLDIVQFTYSGPRDAIHSLRHGKGPAGGFPLRIYRNNRDGTFTDIARERGISECWGTMSGNAGDLGNTGRLDLVLGNGDPSMDRNEATMLLEQGANGLFRNVTFAAGMPRTGKGHGVNLADLTGDGRLHVIVGSGGLYPGDLMTTTVHRPRERPGNYLNVRVQGTRSNRDGIGARIAVTAGGRSQHRIVSGGSNFGCLPFEQHFGLGDGQKIESVEVRWPTGKTQRVDDVAANSRILIVEE